MIKIDIPGDKSFEINNVVFDYNGTIAEDGVLIPKVKELILELVDKDIDVYIVTADTHDSVREQCKDLPVHIETFKKENAQEDKKRIVQSLGGEHTVTIGNGRNDAEMFKSSILSIVIIGKEGCCAKTLVEADIVVTNILDAVELILNPDRIKATLRT